MANFYPDRIVDLIEHNEVAPAVNQIETHPFVPAAADQELMRQHGIQIESWGPFAEGRNDLFSNPVLSEIAAAHGKSVGQVVLRWLTPFGLEGREKGKAGIRGPCVQRCQVGGPGHQPAGRNRHKSSGGRNRSCRPRRLTKARCAAPAHRDGRRP